MLKTLQGKTRGCYSWIEGGHRFFCALSFVIILCTFIPCSLFSAPPDPQWSELEKAEIVIAKKIPFKVPSIAITSPTNNFLTNEGSVNVTGACQFASSVNVNGTAATIVGNTFTANGIPLTEGANLIRATAQNAAGTSSDLREGEADFTMPEVMSITPSLPIYSNQQSITITGVASEPLQEINLGGVEGELMGDGSSFRFQNYTFPVEDSDGTFIYLLDLAGNITRPNFIPVIHDVTNPLVQIISPREGDTLSTSNITITFSAQDTYLDTNFLAAYGATQNFDGTWQYNFIAEGNPETGPDGNWTLYALAADLAGNITINEVHVVIDTLPPIVNVTNPTNGFMTNAPLISVTGTFDQANQVTINGALATINGNAFYLENLPLEEGSNTITIEVTDNTGTTTVNRQVILDTIPPQINMVPSLEERKGMTEEPYIFNAQVTDNDQTPNEYQFEINGDIKQAYSQSNTFTYTPSSNESGNRNLTIRVRDVGGEDSQDVGIYFYRRPV